jgi:hypothetical protein
MTGMKISLDAAMRARDVSRPTGADDAAAESMPWPARPRRPRSGGDPGPTRALAPGQRGSDPGASQPGRKPYRQAGGRHSGRAQRPAGPPDQPARALTEAERTAPGSPAADRARPGGSKPELPAELAARIPRRPRPGRRRRLGLLSRPHNEDAADPRLDQGSAGRTPDCS